MEIPENIKVIEGPAATVWQEENGIVCHVSKKIPEYTLEAAKGQVKIFKSFAKGRKICVLADTTNVSPLSKEVRDYYMIELTQIYKALASVSASPMGRMIITSFLMIDKNHPYPSQNFNNEAEARNWLKQYL
jgi:hypothetical protein